MTIIIEYEPHLAQPVRDGDLARELDYIKRCANNILSVKTSYSTENIFYMVRLAVVRKEIDNTRVYFRYQGVDWALDDYGQCDCGAVGFLETMANLNELILREMFEVHDNLS